MKQLIIELEKDLKHSIKMCSNLNIHSTDYFYWNGVRCQASKTLQNIQDATKDN